MKFWRQMRLSWKVMIISIITVAVMGAAAVPVFAANPALADAAAPRVEAGQRILKGEVTAKDASSFTIKNGDNSTVITVNEGTRYFKATVTAKIAGEIRDKFAQARDLLQERIEATREKQKEAAEKRQDGKEKNPRAAVNNKPNLPLKAVPEIKPANTDNALIKGLAQFGKPATFADVNVGDRVIVVVTGNNDNAIAKYVLIVNTIKIQNVKGTITAIDTTAKTVTLAPAIAAGQPAATPMVFKYDAKTNFDILGEPALGVGMHAGVVYVQNADGSFLARKITARTPPPPPTTTATPTV